MIRYPYMKNVILHWSYTKRKEKPQKDSTNLKETEEIQSSNLAAC